MSAEEEVVYDSDAEGIEESSEEAVTEEAAVEEAAAEEAAEDAVEE
jgi:hypothetical protein